VSEAIFGFLGVIVGAVVSLLGEQFTSRREREARQVLREQDRKDRRDAFQRETILALQDALDDLGRAVAQERGKRLAEQATTGRWPVKLVSQAAPEYHEARWKVSTLRARIFDPELRRLAGRAHAASDQILLAGDAEDMWERMEQGNEMLLQVDRRVTALLSDLF
jgi:hypothetical protein